MFFIYLFWSFLSLFLSYTHVFIEKFFFVKNNPFLIRKRTFKYLSYFEKLFLVLFYKKGWFEKTLANLYRKKDIVDCRRDSYPTIYYFHNISNKFNVKFDNLNLLVKNYNYYLNKNSFKTLYNVLDFCFFTNKNTFIKYLILLNLFFNKYFFMNSHHYFKKSNELNLIKLSKVFIIFLLRSEKKLRYFDLNKWYDWYYYNFNSKVIKKNLNFKKLDKKSIKRLNDFRIKYYFNWVNMVYKYKQKFLKINKFFIRNSYIIIFFKINLNNFFNVKINSNFKKLMKYYKIKFSNSSINKYINSSNLKFNTIFYLRKNRIFNKGRYSRNRQLYRTGVYWCLWLNIIMVYGLYFIFYRFTFNFGYFWWGIMFLSFSTIFSRISKYNFYNFYYLKNEFIFLITWYGFIFNNLINFFIDLLNYFFKRFNLYNYISIYKNIFYFHEIYNFYFLKYFISFLKNRKKIKIVYIWQGMKERDTSFLRYKTVLHWIKEIFRLITT